MAIYKPNLPPVIPVIGEIMRGGIDSGKDSGRLANYGVTFRFDPAEYDPMTYEVRAWEPLRALRESPHFKEIHRALNGLPRDMSGGFFVRTQNAVCNFLTVHKQSDTR